MKKRVAIFISGGGSNMVRLLEDMNKGDHPAEPVLVLANSADAGGLAKAAQMGVKTVAVDHRPFKGDRAAFEAALQAELDIVQPDILCLAGFMRVLTEGFVAPWEGRMLNIHPSLLPKYKGLHTHARAIDAGDKEHGCTVHLVTPALDDGPILGQATVPIEDGDTPETLAARVLKQEHELYPAVLRRFAAGNTTPITL
ncbi:phosphoribosylglycinamide formyltransferase [Shimia sp. R11_0]|uniref:phosphoribosylglycinamide formyltransferase n=1 Tax=Shimia sp. R11_0 TaxID=2821096 RepID=UPI001ADA21E6|nr:phosphoribosylglycinamide formyltransferase [Shimia sp. R11_0]